MHVEWIGWLSQMDLTHPVVTPGGAELMLEFDVENLADDDSFVMQAAVYANQQTYYCQVNGQKNGHFRIPNPEFPRERHRDGL